MGILMMIFTRTRLPFRKPAVMILQTVLQRHLLLAAAFITTALLLIKCSNPGFTERTPVSLSIAPATTAQLLPDNLYIEVYDDADFHDWRSVENPAVNGSVHFKLPHGYYYIDVTGSFNGLKTLYGFSECDAKDDKASEYIVLRNSITIPNISGEQEGLFIQADRPSPIWDGFPQVSTARCLTTANSVIMRTRVATSYDYLYFRCIIDDPLVFGDERPSTALGEMTADAVIIYTCKIPPHELNFDNTPYPVVRVQCETGRTILENGNLSLENLSSGFNIHNIIRDCRDDAITAYLTRQDDLRVLEMRIQRSLLTLPANIEDEPPASIVIRYRDGNTGELSDWQSGEIATNPHQNPDSWGYMELLQE